jgi:asparagine synthase (glutamine-hydrolysing)
VSAIVAAHGPFDPAEGERMLERLAHRGPDGRGSVRAGDAWLGHRRLAIVDIEGGAQPLRNDAGDLWLVGDGEIYNHERIRARLGGERFRTRADFESALHLYDELGTDALGSLWGMFALVAAGRDGRFVAARDTLGIVPLYWARRDGTVLFASEMKAYDESWRPFVESFPGGHMWTPEDGLVAWASSPEEVTGLMRSLGPDEPPPEWALDAVRDVVVRAVERRLAVDVPVGTFLSGGLDSSIVTAIAARAARRDGWTLRTFSAGAPDSDDLDAARQLAELLGTEHHEHVFEPEELIEWVPEVIRVLESFDPTLVHSAVPNYLLAAEAAEHVKVVLIGEGADEIFAGYEHFGAHDSGDDLHAELLATIEAVQRSGLQRADRVTSAHGIEARVPFLDLDVVELALALPPEWKLTRRDRQEKWLLRRAFEGWVPDDLLWRKKAQFGQGTGTNAVLRQHFDATVSDADLARERDAVHPPLRTREELAYHRLFEGNLHGVRADATIARFVEP